MRQVSERSYLSGMAWGLGHGVNSRTISSLADCHAVNNFRHDLRFI